MGSTNSMATSGKVFAPPIWRPNEAKSQEQNVASFWLYVTNMTKQMNSHLEFLQQEISNGESKREKKESSNKRKQGIERDGCGEWPVIIVKLDIDEAKTKSKKGGETKDGGEECKEKYETKEDAEKEVGELEEEGEESEEEDESEEDDETDEDGESDMNSDSETESEEKVAVDLEDVSFEFESNDYNNDDDGDSGSASDFGNCQDAKHKTSEDSSMFYMKISD
ncbi:glutamic acid-rich protein-like [Chenopodium quinoa]|uniref:glutamic acid-rich protein-like n=1 Tax=Chenopodium quinoa TaxID=63459 RepID=UPI000B770351|nr:glutamic acid-rich protein-like [Chenopodium quinoa]